MALDRDRRFLISLLTLAPFAGMLRAAPAAAQTGATLPPIVQPPEKTKAGFLARARALRDQAVKEGDQAYGAVVVRDGVIVGEGRNYVVLQSDPTAHAELLAVRDAARRLNKRDLSDCDVYSTATPFRCAKALCIGRASVVIIMRTRRRAASPRNLHARHGSPTQECLFVTDTIIDGAGEEMPGRRVLGGTDLEIAYSLAGDDLIIRVKKGGTQVFRVLLEDARKQMSERELVDFNSVSPDFVFKIGATGEAIASVGYRLGQVAGKVMKAIRKS